MSTEMSNLPILYCLICARVVSSLWMALVFAYDLVLGAAGTGPLSFALEGVNQRLRWVLELGLFSDGLS